MKISTEKRLVNITLDKDFQNIQVAPTYKITAPDGFSIIYKQTMSNGCSLRLLLSHCGAEVEESFGERYVRGYNLEGTTLKQIESRVLQFESESKVSATDLYKNKIKPALEKMGYIIVKKPECYPYKMKKTEPNCVEDTFDETIKIEEDT